MKVKISSNTVGILIPIIMGLAKSGTLSKSEANGVVRLMKQASSGKSNNPSERKEDISSPKLLTVAQTAKRLSCCKRTIFMMLNEGTLTRVYLRPGSRKSVRIAVEEIDNIINP